ncbi:MAG: hypothetical protein DCC67_12600 [Planctomycetota bacterium]|nr:MAG: hypothetical protein DCC67_12600 [Planctomycetota bacterium]
MGAGASQQGEWRNSIDRWIIRGRLPGDNRRGRCGAPQRPRRTSSLWNALRRDALLMNMPDSPHYRIQPAPGSPPAARSKTRRTPAWLVAAALASVAVVALAALRYRNLQSLAAVAPRRTSANSPPRTAPSDSATLHGEATGATEVVVADPNGVLLWASPTAGPPIALDYVPAGAQCLVHVRPAQILGHSEGQRVLAALGPWGATAVERLSKLTLHDVADIESLLVAVVIDRDDRIDAVLRVELRRPLTGEQLAAGQGAAELREHRGAQYHVRDGRAYLHIGGDAGGGGAAPSTWLIAPASLAEELIESRGASPPLIRDVEALVAHTDRQRLATIIWTPRFLQASGGGLLSPEAAPLADALERLAGPDAAALALSLHLADDFFFELRATPSLNSSPRRLALSMQEHIAKTADALEAYIGASPWHAHGRPVVERLPVMARVAARYTRSGEDQRQALVRCYLPAAAAHNLLMATELVLTQRDSAAPAAATGTASPAAGIEERLAARTSLVFSKETLERAIELLAQDTGIAMTIAGADLQLEGITKNQSFGLELRDRPAGEILVEILRRSNPDRAATGPADPRQKLVYIVQGGEDSGAERIIVTTRSAAEKRGDRLPDIFVGKAD